MKYTSRPEFKKELSKVAEFLRLDTSIYTKIVFEDDDLKAQGFDSNRNLCEIHACVEDFRIFEFRKDLITSKTLEPTCHAIEMKYLCFMAQLFGEEYIDDYSRWTRRLYNEANQRLHEELQKHDKKTKKIRDNYDDITRVKIILAKRAKGYSKETINCIKEYCAEKRQELLRVRQLDRHNLWRMITFERDLKFEYRKQNVSMMRSKLKI